MGVVVGNFMAVKCYFVHEYLCHVFGVLITPFADSMQLIVQVPWPRPHSGFR